MFLEKIKDVSNKMQNLLTRKSKIQNDRTQELLLNATSEKNWHTSTKVLNQLSNLSYNQFAFITSQQLNKIQQFILQRLKSKAWIKLLKVSSFNQTLNLIQHISKNGNELFTNFLNWEMSRLRHLQSFSSYQQGQDKGVSDKRQKVLYNCFRITNYWNNKDQRQKKQDKIWQHQQLGIRHLQMKIVSNKIKPMPQNFMPYRRVLYKLQGKHIGGYNGPTPLFYNQQKNTIDKYRTQEKKKVQKQIEKNKTQNKKNEINQPYQKKQEEHIKKMAFSSQPTKLTKPGYKRETSQKVPQKQISTKIISHNQLNLLQDSLQTTIQQTKKQQQIKVNTKSNTNQPHIKTQNITQNTEIINSNCSLAHHNILNQQKFNVYQPQSSNQDQFINQNLGQFNPNQFQFTFQNNTQPQFNVNQIQFATQNQSHFNYNQTQFNNQNQAQFNVNQSQFMNQNKIQFNVNNLKFNNQNPNQFNINQPQFINPNQITSKNQGQFNQVQGKFINQNQLIQNQGYNQNIMNQKQFSNQKVIQKIQKTNKIKNQDDDFQDFEPLPNEKLQKKQQNKVQNKKLTFDEANLIDLSNLSFQAQKQKNKNAQGRINQENINNFQNQNYSLMNKQNIGIHNKNNNNNNNMNLIKMNKYYNPLPGFK